MKKDINKRISKVLALTLFVSSCGIPTNSYAQGGIGVLASQEGASTTSSQITLTTSSQLLATTMGAYGFNTIYYVDSQSGDDNQDGLSEDTAWKTLNRLNNYVLQPGDKVILNGDFEDEQLKPKGSGEEDNPITITSKDPERRAKINANGKYLAAVLLENLEYFVVDGLEVTNDDDFSRNNIDSGASTDRDTAAGNPGRRIGIHITIDERKESIKKGQKVYNDITVKNCYVHDVDGDEHKRQNKVNGGMGAEVLFNPNNGVYPHFNGINIEDNTIERVGRTGIKTVRLTDLTVGVEEGGDTQRHNNIRNKGQANTNLIIRNNNMSEIEGDGILIDSTEGALIERNVLYNHSMTSAPQATAGIWSWNAFNTTFRFNEAYGGPIYNQDGCSYDADYWCQGNIFEYNYSHDTPMGFMLLMGGNYDDIVRYNISQNDGVIWRHIAGGQNSPAYIYNNIFYYDAAKWKWSYTSIQNGYQFYNNIYYNYNDSVSTDWTDKGNTPINWNKAKISNELVYEASGKYGSNEIPGALHTDPQFINPGGGKANDWASLEAYKVANTSPVINAGTYVPVQIKGGFTKARPITTDFYGNPLYNGMPDIGVHEYEGNDIPERLLEIEENGTYKILSGMDQRYIIRDPESSSIKLVKADTSLQEFVLSTIGDYYKIRSFDTNTGEYKYLTAGENGVTVENAKIENTQVWEIVDNKNGLVTIMPLSNKDKALTNDGETVKLTTQSAENNQYWFLELKEYSKEINVGGTTIEGFSSDRLFEEEKGALGRYGTVETVSGIGNFTGKEEVYNTGIKGDIFGYKVAVPRGEYTVKLNFIEPEFEIGGRSFDILINGKLVKEQYDIAQKAGGKDKPVVEEIGFIYPENGYIDVKLQGAYAGDIKTPALLSGISIEKTIATDVTLLFNSGGGNEDGMAADVPFKENGSGYYDITGTSQSTKLGRPIPDGGMPTVMGTGRIGEGFGYKFKLAPREYRVKLLFNDTLVNNVGERIFDISINDQMVQENFDIVKVAGGKQKTVALTFDVKPKNNYLDIQFIGKEGSKALVSAVLVEPYISYLDPNQKVLDPVAITSSANESVDKGPQYAIDGNEATRWASGQNNNGRGHWLSVDLGNKCLVDGLDVDWTFGAYATKYKVEVSIDGTTWEEVKQVDAALPGLNRIKFEPVEAQYVRVTGQEANDVWGISLYEIRVYGNKTVGQTMSVPTMQGEIGKEHTLSVSIKNAYKRYSTMTVELAYNSKLLEYIGQETYMNNKVKLVGQPIEDSVQGKVTYNFEITSQTAFDDGIDFINIKFKPKTNERSFITIKTTLSDPAAHLTQLPFTRAFINNDMTKEMLQTLIDEVREYVDSVQIGNQVGDYAVETVEQFKVFIDKVQSVHDRADVTVAELALAYEELLEQFEIFKNDYIEKLYETYARDYSVDSYENDYKGTGYTVNKCEDGTLEIALQAGGKVTNQIAVPLKDSKLKVRFSVNNVNDQLHFRFRGDQDSNDARLTIDGASIWCWEDSTEGNGWGPFEKGKNLTLVPNKIYNLTIKLETIDAYKSKMSVWVDDTFIGEKTTTFRGKEAGTFSISTRRNARTLKIYEIAYTNAHTPEHTLTVSAGANGTVNKIGKINVLEEMDKTFTFVPDEGYVVDTVTVDGVPVVVTNNQYTFEFIRKSHTLEATFKKEEVPVIKGSYKVHYEDENGMPLAGPKVVGDLSLGEYEEEALAIEGYTLVGENKQSIILTEEETNKEIRFSYRKNPKTGSYKVHYEDENGMPLTESKVVEDLPLGEYEEEALAIEGYTLVGENKQSIILTEEETNKEICFSYRKNKIVESTIKEVISKNGKIEVRFENAPETLELQELETSIQINDKKEKELSITSFTYDKGKGIAILTFKSIHKRGYKQKITISVTYKDNKIIGNTFEVETTQNSSTDDTGSNDTSNKEDKTNQDKHKEVLNKELEKEALLETAKESIQDLFKLSEGIGKVTKLSHIPTNHWAYEAIRFMSERKIIKLDEQVDFNLSEKVTRGETAQYLGRLLGLQEVTTSKIYIDVKDNEEYAGYLEQLKVIDIMNGVSEDTFDPEALLTREQMSSILVRTYEVITEKEIDIKDVELKFLDEDISQWAEEDIKKGQYIGLIKGITNERFMPKQEVTKAQFMIMLQRLIEGIRTN